MATSKKPVTYDDLVELPPYVVGEIVDDELYASPRPANRHAAAYAVLVSELVGPFQFGKGGPGGWVILAEPELHLGKQVLVPDLAAWRRERMPEIPDAPYFTLAPDWVCEIVSPSTERLDRAKKMPIYARKDVRHLWLVDPIAKCLEVYRRAGDGWEQANTFREPRIHAEPFDAIELDLAALWAR